MSLPLAAALAAPIADLVAAITRSVLEGDSPEETARKALVEATKIQNLQKVYDQRALGKFSGFKP
jgi:hypothetical protein